METEPVNNEGAMHPENLFQLFLNTSAVHSSRGILAYAEGNVNNFRRCSYLELKQNVWEKSAALRAVKGFQKGKVIMIHFQDHLDNIFWFWAVLFAGCIPAMSTPLGSDLKQRRAHLQHLFSLLENPLLITRRSQLGDFSVAENLRVFAIEDLTTEQDHSEFELPTAAPNDIAALVLTSGTTGHSKAVCLTHGQILISSLGKSTIVHLPEGSSILNWVGIDHVAGLMDAHMLAVFLGLDQVHVQARDMVSDPMRFLELIAQHQVSRTFAPNFFLVSLLNVAASIDKSRLDSLNLGCLRCLVSGGEPNPVHVCNRVAQLLSELGAPENALVPGFGMSETAAGAFFNMRCPSFDNQHGGEYASQGQCVAGIEMRVRCDARNFPSNEPDETSRSVRRDLIGPLEIRGPIVFKEYFNNKKATTAAFDRDGWFDTGDQAMIDTTDSLHIVGRIKDTIRVNSQTFLPQDLEHSINDVSLPGVAKDYCVCFSYFPKEEKAERICVIYLPTYHSDDVEARFSTADKIASIILTNTGTYPYILPVDSALLQKSTLGKLSRGKVKKAFIEGDLRSFQRLNEVALSQYHASSFSQPETETQKSILRLVSETLLIGPGSTQRFTNVNQSLMEFGISSLQLIRLQKRIEQYFNFTSFPLTTLMRNPTVRMLAGAITNNDQTKRYDPVVKLRESGPKQPLWLFHPGVGEILVFLKLAKLISDRPVYALRARGFNEGETFFASIEEAVDTYFNAIVEYQPSGPYALAGYSYGAMLAFETAKRLEKSGRGPVQFLGSMNLPPHIKMRMRQLDWAACLRHLAFFVGLVSESRSETLIPDDGSLTRRQMADAVVGVAEASRLQELGLTAEGLVQWADLAFAAQDIARDYEPSGTVSAIDVFYCNPLPAVAPSKQFWFDEHISKWQEFAETAPRFHDVEGSHYTMISPEHVGSFYQVLQSALSARGI